MTYMSRIITISVDEKVEIMFRKRAGMEYGRSKGYLGKAVTEAMREWLKKKDTSADERFLKIMHEGVKVQKWKFNRDELHDR